MYDTPINISASQTGTAQTVRLLLDRRTVFQTCFWIDGLCSRPGSGYTDCVSDLGTCRCLKLLDLSNVPIWWGWGGEIHGTFVLKKKKEKKMAVKHGSHVITLLVAGVHCSVEWNFS